VSLEIMGFIVIVPFPTRRENSLVAKGRADPARPFSQEAHHRHGGSRSRRDYEPHSGSIPSLSLTARLSLCLQPRYRSVV